MTLIIHCQGPCAKQMGSLEPFRVKEDKYLCLNCAGEKAKVYDTGRRDTKFKVFKSPFESIMQDAYYMNNDKPPTPPTKNFTFFFEQCICAPEQDTILGVEAKKLHFCVEGRIHQERDKSLSDFEPFTFDLLIWRAGPLVKIVTIEGYKYKDQRMTGMGFIAYSLWE